MTFDVERARADTPGCREIVHLNNAGASLPPQVVLETVVAHLELEARIGGYAAADAAAEPLAAVYDSVASLIGANPDEIALVESATRAWDMAFYALAATLEPGDRVLVGQSEYASNVIAALQVARRTGAVVDAVPDDERGQLSVDALAAMIDERTKLVAIGWIPTQGGLVNPVHSAGRDSSGGPARHRRRHHRLRLPVRNRAQVPASPARHRLPLRTTRLDRTTRTAVPRRPRGTVGSGRSHRDPP